MVWKKKLRSSQYTFNSERVFLVATQPGKSIYSCLQTTKLGLTLREVQERHSIYGRNANVFAAVPSLHAAYMVVALVYAIIGKCRWYVIALFSVIMAGIWGTAIYSCHHYIIDVLLGISCALLGWLFFEYGLMKIRGFRNFFDRYYQYIK